MTEPTNALVPASSILDEALPNSLDELFSRDPLDLSDSDIDTIVAGLRRARSQWMADEASGKSRASKPKPTPGPKPTIASLADLGL